MRKIFQAAMFLLLVSSLSRAAEVDYSGIPAPEAPYSIEGLRAWHQAMNPWPWPYPPGQEIHLRKAEENELLLCFAAGSRDGRFTLFAKLKGAWKQIGVIGQAHQPIRVLKHQVSGWHDFETFLPLWGNGGHQVLVLRYRWTGSGYEELSRSEGMFNDYEPFKSAPAFRNARPASRAQ